jgi:hypothetical protein
MQCANENQENKPTASMRCNILCDCSRAARCERVKKYGPTQGQLFWTCSLPLNDVGRCEFFLWDNLPEAKRLLFRRTRCHRRRNRWSPY